MWIWWLWWQSNTIHSTQHFLVAIAGPSVERLCRAIATIVRSYYTANNIVQSYSCNYCAGLLILLLLLCRASSTTLVQSYYYYYCAELLRLLLCRASTSTLALSARARCPQLFLADEGLPRQIKSNWRQWTTQQCYWQQCLWKENHRALQECLLYTKSGWTMVKLFDLEVEFLHLKKKMYSVTGVGISDDGLT